MEKNTHPARKTSANLRKAELTKIGYGYFSRRAGTCTIASHCSPGLLLRNPNIKNDFFIILTK